MKYELTAPQLAEIAQCISINDLTPDEACDYVMSVAEEMQEIEDAVIEWPEESRIERIGQNGNNGEHYLVAHKAGVYEA